MMKQLLSYSVKTLASLMTILKLSLTSNVGYFLEIIATLSETFLLKNKERHFLVFFAGCHCLFTDRFENNSAIWYTKNVSHLLQVFLSIL